MSLFNDKHTKYDQMRCTSERNYGPFKWTFSRMFSRAPGIRCNGTPSTHVAPKNYYRAVNGLANWKDNRKKKLLIKTVFFSVLFMQLCMLLLSSRGVPDPKRIKFNEDAKLPKSAIVDRLSKDYSSRVGANKKQLPDGFVERKISSIRDDQDLSDRTPFSSSAGKTQDGTALDRNAARRSRSRGNKLELGERPSVNDVFSWPLSSSVVDPTLKAPGRSNKPAPRYSNKPLCPVSPPNLMGKLEIVFNATPPTIVDTARHNTRLRFGGAYDPPDCEARYRVAFIVPHRAREMHLRALLWHLHPILQRQQLHYKIYVIQQAGNLAFNKAKLMNAGVREAMKEDSYDCFVFHDVDLLPENDRLLYTCDKTPKHLSVAIDKYNYKLPYNSLFGGVTVIGSKEFKDVNGFSNKYWGWGGEDDDMYSRLYSRGYEITRPPDELARYKMCDHQRDKGNKLNLLRFEILRNTEQRMRDDGVNNVQYSVVSVEANPVYTNVTVNVGTAVVQCLPTLGDWACDLVFWMCEHATWACGWLQYNSTDEGTLPLDWHTRSLHI